MERYKKIILKLLYPPLWLVILLAVVSSAALTAVFLKGCEESYISYFIYVLSFYTLTVLCALCVKVLPDMFKRVRNRMYGNKIIEKMSTDAAFKTKVTLYLSLTLNLLYAGLNFIFVLLYKSAWFGILCGYYVILALMRFLLVRYVRTAKMGTNHNDELKRSRLCAVILMTVNIVLSGAVLMIIYQNRGYEYHGMLIYVMAAYTFYVTTHSVINVFKYRKMESPVMTTAKCINLCAALVSMLALETAMLAQFGADSSEEFRRIMIAVTGAGVSIVVITMSVYLIIKSTMEINENRGKENGK